MTDQTFHDLAASLRSRLADVEDRFIVDQLAREHANLQLRLSILEAKLAIAGLADDQPTLSVVAGDAA